MIIGLIIAVGIAIGAILFGLQAAQTIPEAIANVLIQSMRILVGNFFLFLAAILPLIAMAIPLYILRNREEEVIIFGALYGLGFALLTIVLGLQSFAVDVFRSSWYSGWTTSIIPELAGAVYSLFYYIIGAFLFFVDDILAVMIGLSKPMAWLRRNVTQKAIRKWKKHKPKR